MQTYILSVGGSIFSLSDEILFDFNKAEELKNMLQPFLERGDQFILAMGGGYICRKYQKLMREKGLSDKELDNVGVATINTNAVLLRAVMGDQASEKILRYEDFNSGEPLNFDKQIIVAAASHPGHSSDWNAVKLAMRCGAKSLVNVSNTKGVYDSDPKENPNAKFLSNLTWDEYFNIVGNPTDFVPGAHFPFDIMAARMAKENGIECYMIDGSDMNILKDILNNEEFTGSVIHP